MKDRLRRRSRELSISKPTSAIEARDAIYWEVMAPLLVVLQNSPYRGDYYLDKDLEWHQK